MRTRIEEEIPKEGHEEFDLVAYDSTDDRVRNYDTFYVEHAGTETPLDAQRWFSISTRFAGGLYGSWSKLVKFDPALNEATLYLGSVNRNEGLPASYVRLIEDDAGFWPGTADEHLVDRQTFIEQTDRLSSFLTRATTVSIQRMPFDLLLAYQPIVDSTEHHLRGIDEPAIAMAISDADRAIGALANTIDPARDALVVVGDHGVAKVEMDVHINRILKSARFAPRWTAYTSGNVVMLSRGSEPDDTAALIDFLQNLSAPDGSKVFEKVQRDYDITAIAWPRFGMSSKEGEPFTPPEVPGQHGGLNTHREYDTLLLAWGRGVTHETLASLPQMAIANFVMRLLGIR
jgi:predicted AlkP superfamily pyrophosphatase or phosphodiesterase